jgi:hypothetical protein
MKKLGVTLLCAAFVVAAFSCATNKGGVADNSPAGDGSAQLSTDAALDAVYDAYRASLILDGAKGYTVKSGDTLTKITVASYGSENGKGYFFPIIMAASNTEIADPDKIYPGMELLIPDLQKNLDSAAARADIKILLLEVAAIYNRKGDTSTEAGLRKLSASL